VIAYRPDYIVSSCFGHCCVDKKQPMDYLPLYEHFARKVLDCKLPREVLADRSAIHVSAFDVLSSQKNAQRILAKLFLAAGTGDRRGMFLRRCGIRKWSDLAKPFRVQGRPSQRCFAESITYDVRERRLVQPGPNECHPGAIYAQEAWFQFGTYDRLWQFNLGYGYSRDPSTWTVALKQGRGESLRTFVDERVPKWLETRLEPESDSGVRRYRNCRHDKLTSAVGEVFGWNSVKAGITTHLLVTALLDRKPELTGRRLAALRRWIKADREADRPRGGARSPDHVARTAGRKEKHGNVESR